MKSGKFWLGIISGIILSGVVGLLIVPFLGVFPASATGKTNILDWWGHTNLESFLERKSPDANIPAEADLGDGTEDYLAMCLHCHGGPGAERQEWANHMLPLPPKLWKQELQDEMSDGEIFYVISNGIRMTGMPAFGEIHSDRDIWNMVAFVRQLPQLTEQQKQVMLEASNALHHVEDHEIEEKHHGEDHH